MTRLNRRRDGDQLRASEGGGVRDDAGGLVIELLRRDEHAEGDQILQSERDVGGVMIDRRPRVVAQTSAPAPAEVRLAPERIASMTETASAASSRLTA